MTELTTTQDKALATAGTAANRAAGRAVIQSYQQTKAANTLRRHRFDLLLFAEYLGSVGADIEAAALGTNPAAWAGITWGIVEGFKRWLLAEGYAVASVNQRLSTVKVYAGLAARAGAITGNEPALIAAIRGFSRKEGRHIDDRRAVARLGRKKGAWVSLGPDQVRALKAQPPTPQGRRDSLIVCFLADLGLRCGELAGLAVGDVDLKARQLRFYRPKVDIEQTHRLPADSLQAARAYSAHAHEAGPLLRASKKNGQLTTAGMSTQAISARVRTLAAGLGIDSLSAHDLRHFWATQAARNGTPVDRLQQAGGWASPVMALRYVDDAAIANEGVNIA